MEGDCLVGREGVLFVYAVDEEGFASPMTGLREVRLRVGPAEPWGMSWSRPRRSGFPKFDDIAFLVDRDIRRLQIEVK